MKNTTFLFSIFSIFAGGGVYLGASYLERLFALGLEMLKNSSLKAFWDDFWAWAWKSLKLTSWKASGVIFGPGPGNT